MVNNALGKCMKECQDAAVDGLADDASDAEVEVGRSRYMRCTQACPEKTKSVVLRAFANLKEEISLLDD